ncbi:MAG TPA: tripartite tricarboxylate transporter substrate binding protein [Hyphomicrobiaceae bacterium]|nr:tripartite tricarboxylate transporter substrate binding protein [Hyphomicrobiaceae bacterium]
MALCAVGLALLLLLVLVPPSMGQTWPQRPVKFIVTLGPGSGVDFGTRLLGDRLSKRWGQPVVIENRPGGDAIVAVTAVTSANDDHVLLASPTSALTAHPYILQQMPYQDSDLLPIARGWNTVIVIAVPTSMDVKTMRDLVAMTHANPGKLNWAGTTGAIDFLFAGFLKKNNLDMARVPYRNPQDAANDVATGRIQVTEASLATLRPQLQAGKIKMLASTNSVRPPTHPEVPTVTEAGYPELTLDGLVGFFGPQGMSLALRERIAADMRDVVQESDFVEKLSVTGQIANAGGPAEFAAAIKEQRERLAVAAKELGLKTAQ